MEDNLKRTFINQLISFSHSLERLIADRKVNKTVILEKLKYYSELKNFATQKCEKEVVELFNKLDEFEQSLLTKYNLFNLLKYIIIGLLFYFLCKRSEEKIFEHLKNMKGIVDRVILYYKN